MRCHGPDPTGRYRLELQDNEAEVLTDLIDQLERLLHDPSQSLLTHRLFPPGHDDPLIATELAELTHGDLQQSHQDALEILRNAALGRNLDEQEMLAAIRAVNSLRLVLATATGAIHDDETEASDVDQTDPVAGAILSWLAWLLDELVSKLDEGG